MSYIIYIDGKKVNNNPISFTQTKQVNDIANITTRNSNFTQTVKVPRTATNSIIFEMAFNIGSSSTVPYKKATCDVIDADTGQHVVYKGWAVLLESTPTEYSITIYDGSIDFYRSIENITLTEVGISELNHIKNLENVVETWNDTDLPYRYILADYNGNNDASGNVNIDFQVPAASVPYLWDKVFEFIGWNYIGNVFLHEKFTNLWLTYPKPTPLEVPITDLVTEQTSIIQTDVVTYPVGGGVFYGNVSYVNFFPIISDIDSDYYSLTGGVTTGGLYRFSFTGTVFQLQGTTTVTSSRVRVIVYDNLNQVVSTNYINISLDNYIDVLMNAGDRIYLSLVYENTDLLFNGQSTPSFTTLLSGEPTEMTMELITGYSLGFDQAFIDYKVSDFVKDIMIRFGLTPFKDKYSNTVTFLTLTEYLQNTNIDNWTSKFSKKLSEKYVFGSYAKVNTFRYKYNDDEAKHNDGSFVIDNQNLPEQYFILNSQIFSPESALSEFLGQSNVYKIWNKEIKDDNTVEYKGLDGRFYFMRADLVDSEITVGSNILGGTETNGYYYRESYYRLPFNNIIDDWYRPMKAIFDKSKLLTIEAFLKPIDIFNFDFSRLIFIEQLASYYLVNKINTFVKGKPTKVELIELDYFTEAEPIIPTPIDYFVSVTDYDITDCEITLAIDTNYPLPVDCEFVVYEGGLDVLSNPTFNELVIMPTQTDTLSTNEVTFSLSQLPYNVLGYKFGIKIYNASVFQNIYSTTTDVIVLDGSCYVEPSLTELEITNAVLISSNGLSNTYELTFTSDVTLPVQVLVQSYQPPSGGFPLLFGGWSAYQPYYATTFTITVVVGILFGAPTKFKMKIGTIESPEYIL